jgi:hypothetical protein
MKTKLIFTLLVLSWFKNINAQINEGPPSLAIGINGLSFSKGTLDPEIIAEIIADKQDNLKKEFVNRYILGKLEGHSYTVWEFTYNSLDALLNTKDKKIIQKRLLESSANLALVYMFMEGYLNASRKLGNTDLVNFLSSLDSSGIIGKEPLSRPFKEFLVNSVDQKYFTPGVTLKKLESGLFKDIAANELKYDNPNYNGSNTKDVNTVMTFTNNWYKFNTEKIQLNEFLLDLFYDELKDNKKLVELGFFKSWKPIGEDFYNNKSLYRKHLDKLKSSTAYNNFIVRLRNEVDLLLNNYYLTELMNSYRVANLNEFIEFLPQEVKADSIKSISQSVSKNLFENIGSLPNANSKPDSIFKSKYKTLREDVVRFTEFTDYLRNETDTTYPKLTITDLYYSNERIYKSIQGIAKYCQAGCLDGINLEEISKLNKNVAALYLKKLSVSDAFKPTIDRIKSNNIVEYSVLVGLIQRMHRLDQAETYDYILNSIKYFGEIILGDKAPVLNIITENMEKYAIIDKDKNQINIKAEEIIEALYNKYGEASFSIFKNYPVIKLAPYFTVGANAGSWYYSNKDSSLFLSIDSVNGKLQPLKSLSMVSEKIGIKLMADFKANRNINQKKGVERNKSLEPFIHDAHMLLYVSGILYNVTSTTTKKNFKYPLYGMALGLSFYNGLDANLFVSSPIVPNENLDRSFGKRFYYGVGFDVKIVEYLAAIRKKRQGVKSESTSN